MEIEFMNYRYNNELLNFCIKGKEINGLCGNDKKKLLDIIRLQKNFKGTIKINNQEISKEELYIYKNKINYIPEELDNVSFFQNVYDLMLYEIKKRNLILKNPEKKIKDSMRIVGLDPIVLTKGIEVLSTSEKKHLQLAICLLSNPDLIIIESPFKFLDIKNEKKIMILLQKIKEQYNKTILFVSDDMNELYKYTTNLLIFKNDKMLAQGPTTEIFQRVDFLKRNRIEIPEIVMVTYLAKKKKNIKLEYHKDIRDIIKDIYKHV